MRKVVLSFLLMALACPAFAGVTALTDGTTVALDASQGTAYSLTLGGNHTLANPTNLTAGTTYVLTVTQDSTGGRALSYGSAYKAAAAAFPVLSTAAGEVDVLQLYATDSSTLVVSQMTKNAQTLVLSPSSLSGSSPSPASVSLSWTNNATDGTAVEVWADSLSGACSGTSTFWGRKAVLSASATSYTDTTQSSGATVCYRVRTVRNDVYSAYSADVSVDVQ